ncbi:MAG: PVC-type heme-binding CxxCH protein [Pirellulales bacterium]
MISRKPSAVRAAYTLVLLALIAILFSPAATLRAADENPANAQPQGELPRGAEGKPLNLDFESGTLADWTAGGEAFAQQPIKGDAPTARGRNMPSHHQGDYWIGGFEFSHSDLPQGTLTSAPFKVTTIFASFRIAGGSSRDTRVELVRRDTNRVIFARSGDDTETLKPVVVELLPHMGQEIFVRLVDASSGGWGHVNFDNFRLHVRRPEFPDEPKPAEPDEYPFAGLPPTQAAEHMTVPEGFRVTLVAGEPDVKQPIAQAIDDRGRLWIAEAYTYPIRAPEGKGRDRVLIFEDANGDGSFETRKVFLEGLNLVSGLEVGFGGVWIGAAPHLLFVPDRNADDKPDAEPQVLLDGWHYEDTHETLNTFTWGPDGWLYGCHGVFTHSNVGQPGTPKDKRTPINAGIWRYHPTRHVFEVFAEGTSNPWGVDFNDYGQCFCTACVIPHLYHMIQGGRYQRQAGQHFNPDTYDDIKTIAVHRHWIGDTPHSGNNRSDAAGGGHAHAGAMIYLGGSWPAQYRDQIFMNNIHGQRINQDLLAAKGSGYSGDRAPDFCLARDRWSQILNLQYGPDGQVFMIDWYDENACHHRDPNNHDRTNGRIFKIVYRDAKPVRVDLQSLGDQELAGLLTHDNDWHVRHARRVLQERGPKPELRATLARLAFEHPDETRRLRGLWALHATGNLDDELVARGLENDHPHVRAWTIQLLTDDPEREVPSAVRAHLAEMAKTDPSPVVRLYLSSALGRLPREASWPILPGLLAHAEDALDHNLPLMYWYAAEPLAEIDAARALTLAADGKIPLVFGFMTRRVARIGTPEALAVVVGRLAQTTEPQAQLTILQAIATALTGRRQVPMPEGWAAVSPGLMASNVPELAAQATSLALTFGDPQALARMRQVLVDDQATLPQRKQALEALLATKDKQLAPTLQRLLATAELRSDALRGLAAFDDEATPAAILGAYRNFSQEEKRNALATLASRAKYATALLESVGDKSVPASDLTADLVRQLRNLDDPAINESIARLWGVARKSSEEKAAEIARVAALVKRTSGPPADPWLGRAVFAKTCAQCHTLFGAGGKIGPELTGSNRANLDYLLSNMLDPSAVMAKEYQPTVLATTDGRVITGLVVAQNPAALTVQTANEQVVIPRDEIEASKLSEQSMMPDDLLRPLSDVEVRSLVAYLAGPAQVPVLATTDNLKNFFNGTDLTGWQGDAALWSVENGEIVGRTKGLAENKFLAGDLALANFRLKVEVNLVDNRGNSGIQFRSQLEPDGLVKGYQADIGPDWWGKLYEEHGRGLLWTKSGEAHLKSGWNTYEIEATGPNLRTWLNGQLCVDLEDTSGARRGIMALQLHSGGPTEVRFRNFELQILP